MPNMLDGVGVPLPTVSKDICPICEKAAHDTKTREKEKTGCLQSIPANLGCVALGIVPGLPNYTTAAHHLIPANQCLKPMARLCQVCKTVGYDVNNSANGMSLPTIGQKEANVYGAQGLKYGSLEDADKHKVAFLVMDGLNLQWHVGHHNWKPLNLDTDGKPHPPNYDKLVKQKLLEKEKAIKTHGKDLCAKDEDERDKDVTGDLNDLSGQIKGKVAAWKQYFVSALSIEFAKKYR